MWISVPTPETTSIIVTDSVSTRKAQATLKRADGDPIGASVTVAPSGCAQQRQRQQHGDDERQRHRQAGDDAGEALAQALAQPAG